METRGGPKFILQLPLARMNKQELHERSLLIFLMVFLFTNECLPQDATIFHIDTLSSDGVLLDKWKFQIGDDSAYANPRYDDKAWETNWTADFTRADAATTCESGRPKR